MRMNPIHLHHVFDYTDVDREFWQAHLEDFVPSQVIDAHVHLANPAHCLRPPSEEIRRQFWVHEVAEPIDADQFDRAETICYPGRRMSFVCFGHPDLSWDAAAGNAYISQQAVRRGWAGLVTLNPQWSAEQLIAQLDQPGIIGVKPYYAMLPGNDGTHEGHMEAGIFDFLTHEHLEVLNQRGGWVTLHVPKAQRLGHPDNIRDIREIRRRYPDVRLVIAHFGRSYTEPHAVEGLLPLADVDGLYFDNSAVLNPAVHRVALKHIGPGRILYGTDNPIFYMRGRREWRGKTYINHTSYPFHFNTNREAPEIEARYTLYIYEALRALKTVCEELSISRRDVEDMFYGNARRLIDSASSRKRGG